MAEQGLPCCVNESFTLFKREEMKFDLRRNCLWTGCPYEDHPTQKNGSALRSRALSLPKLF